MLMKILAVALSGICLAPGLIGQQTQQDLPATPLTEMPIALKGGEIAICCGNVFQRHCRWKRWRLL